MLNTHHYKEMGMPRDVVRVKIPMVQACLHPAEFVSIDHWSCTTTLPISRDTQNFRQRFRQRLAA
jgi:hypothetical protein